MKIKKKIYFFWGGWGGWAWEGGGVSDQGWGGVGEGGSKVWGRWVM